MAEHWQNEPWAKDMWWSGKTTRRTFLGLSATAAGALGATMLVPAPWRAAFGQAKPFKVGVLQPLSGVAAAGGKTALVGTQVATDRINKSGGINGRPVELVIADYESKPDVGRALRLRPRPGRRLRALPGQQDGQEVAHRVPRLCVGPDHP